MFHLKVVLKSQTGSQSRFEIHFTLVSMMVSMMIQTQIIPLTIVNWSTSNQDPKSLFQSHTEIIVNGGFAGWANEDILDCLDLFPNSNVSWDTRWISVRK